ncbi:hypothetical protein EI94DRAFT_1732969 [Lactarius quietus]|nr:hypothetical protein EI94DRAFT_1732969 [Lactarius quietus]
MPFCDTLPLDTDCYRSLCALRYRLLIVETQYQYTVLGAFAVCPAFGNPIASFLPVAVHHLPLPLAIAVSHYHLLFACQLHFAVAIVSFFQLLFASRHYRLPLLFASCFLPLPLAIDISVAVFHCDLLLQDASCDLPFACCQRKSHVS